MNPVSELIRKLDEHNLWQETLSFERNEHIKVHGSTDTNIYYVVSGSLRVYVIDPLEEQTIRFGYPGNVITALDSFITGRPSEFYIQALKKTELKVISKPVFMKFISESPGNQSLWIMLLEALVFQQMERERDLLTSSPVERYKRVLKRSPQVFQEIPHKYIASYLRMTPETLSRIKKS